MIFFHDVIAVDLRLKEWARLLANDRSETPMGNYDLLLTANNNPKRFTGMCSRYWQTNYNKFMEITKEQY